MFSKRGEVTSAQIVGLVMALIGFIVVLILLFSLNFEGVSNDETCRLSVITRASIPSVTQGYVPLKCTTDKICITDKLLGGECKQFVGEKGVSYVRLSGTDPEKARQIEKVMAESMYDCWSIMGEGKLDLFADTLGSKIGLDGLLNSDPAGTSCVICTRIALADDVLKNNNVRNQIDFPEYLERENVPGTDKTFLETFTNNRFSSYPASFDLSVSEDNSKQKGTDQIAFLFSQIKTETDPLAAAGEGAIGSTALLVGGTAAVGKVLGPAVILKGVNPYTAIATLVGIGTVAGFRYVGASRDQRISASFCGKFNTLNDKQEKNRFGCSIVAPVDYNNIDRINSFCGKIEGSP